MNIILYTTGCPRCKVLEKKLEMKGLAYDTIEDINIMTALGISSVPMMQVDGSEIMDFAQANKWINGVEANNG